MDHILVPVDLSEHSPVACRYAAELARRLHARVSLLHVDEVQSLGFWNMEALGDYLSRLDELRKSRMEALGRLFSAVGLEYQSETASGRPDRAILHYAQNQAVDLIVMARRGHAPLSRFFIGSTSENVSCRGNIPTILVPSDEHSAGRPARPPGRILAPTDFSGSSMLGLEATLHFADAIGADVTLLHVVKFPGVFARTLRPSGSQLDKAQALVADASQEKLQQILDELGSDRLDFCVAAHESVAEGIVTTALEEEMDLISMPTRGGTGLSDLFLGSTTKRVLHVSRLPVLVLPRDYLDGLEPEFDIEFE